MIVCSVQRTRRRMLATATMAVTAAVVATALPSGSASAASAPSAATIVAASKASAATKAAPQYGVLVRGSVAASPMTVVNCGIVTCSLYLSRAQTRQLNTNIIAAGGGIAGLAASCGLFSLMSGPAAPIVAVACGVSISVYGGFMLNAVSRAAGDNGCLRVRYPALAFYDDHSSYCHNT